MDKALKHRINTGKVAVQNQIAFFRKQFGQATSRWKEDDTRVTFVDFAISEKIFAELRSVFPDDIFCSEEANPSDEVLSLERGYSWILDPVDGTNNYALGLPSCAVSLALLFKGNPLYGFIYDHGRDTLIHGGPRIGIWDGSRRVKPENVPLHPQTIFGTQFPHSESIYDALKPLLTRYRVRCLGSATLAMAYTALGILDGCIDYRVRVWDIAAAYALMRESGRECVFVDWEVFPLNEFHVSQPQTPYFAGTPEFCSSVRERINITAKQNTIPAVRG